MIIIKRNSFLCNEHEVIMQIIINLKSDASCMIETAIKGYGHIFTYRDTLSGVYVLVSIWG